MRKFLSYVAAPLVAVSLIAGCGRSDSANRADSANLADSARIAELEARLTEMQQAVSKNDLSPLVGLWKMEGNRGYEGSVYMLSLKHESIVTYALYPFEGQMKFAPQYAFFINTTRGVEDGFDLGLTHQDNQNGQMRGEIRKLKDEKISFKTFYLDGKLRAQGVYFRDSQED